MQLLLRDRLSFTLPLSLFPLPWLFAELQGLNQHPQAGPFAIFVVFGCHHWLCYFECIDSSYAMNES